MSRRRPPARGVDVQGPPMLDELHAFGTSTETQLSERYGSLDRAERREDFLFAQGVLKEGRHKRRDWSNPDAGGVELIDGRELGEL